jgi:hypothetical protein
LNRCGKLVVAKDDADLLQLDELRRRAAQPMTSRWKTSRKRKPAKLSRE